MPAEIFECAASRYIIITVAVLFVFEVVIFVFFFDGKIDVSHLWSRRGNRSLIDVTAQPVGVASCPISIFDRTLVFTEPISTFPSLSAVDERGFLTKLYDPKIETFSVDVGVNRGKVIHSDWLEKIPHLFVIGIEANHELASRIEFGEEFRSIRHRSIIIKAAVASRRGTFAKFNTGAGWNGDISDTGSLFNWTDPRREQSRLAKRHDFEKLVRFVRLDDILQHVPPPRQHFFWDTLKIDIQGADVDALLSAGEYLRNFVCVVGEFKADHYAIPKDFPTDPEPILKAANFVKVYSEENQIWINKRFSRTYLAKPEHFGCHRVYDSQVDPFGLARQLNVSLAQTTAAQA